MDNLCALKKYMYYGTRFVTAKTHIVFFDFHLNKLTGVGKILYINLKLNCVK